MSELSFAPIGVMIIYLNIMYSYYLIFNRSKDILETFEKEQRERMQASWRRANEAKKLKMDKN
jgi:hypothetical protein